MLANAPACALVAAGVAVFVVPDTLAALQRLAAGRRDRRRAKVIGVTGSVGKTTTKELIAAVLGNRYPLLKSEANYNNEIGLPLTLLGLTHRHRRAVLEMAMRAISRRTGLKHEMVITAAVSSMIMSIPLAASSARILRPSRPIIRPFISSLGISTVLVVDSAVWAAA